jgi:hypothetical protein
MITKTLPDGTVRVQAWACTRPGHVGMTVYNQATAIDQMAEGFDVQILAIDRHPDGSRSYLKGVLV